MDDPRKHADLYRMVTAEHICPFGLKSRHLLHRAHGAFLSSSRFFALRRVK